MNDGHEVKDYEMLGRMRAALDLIEGCPEIAPLIPEVRTNLVYAKKGARMVSDVLAVEGRITVVGGAPKASGPIRFGASSHLARLILNLQPHEPSIRSAVNFANDPEIVIFLEDYCRHKGWTLIAIDRSKEPEDVIAEEGRSVPWKAQELLRSNRGKVPEIAYENGAVGKEPVSALIGEDPVELASRLCELARAYSSWKQPSPKMGKVSAELLNSVILGNIGKRSEKVLVPPRVGVDAAVIDLGEGQVLVIAEDPIFTVPGMTMEVFGWATVHIGASDIAVMGVDPQFMTYSLLLPPGTGDATLSTIVQSISKAAEEIGISIVGGHTGYYPGLMQPMIGGVTVFSIAKKEDFVSAAGARPGDDIILTKGPAIEASAALALLKREWLEQSYPQEIVQRAIDLIWEMSVVKDAGLAMRCGGVRAMHDATEGGVIGGLWEIADASGVGMEVDEVSFVYPDEVRMVCEALDMDPLEAISEGSLLLTCDPNKSAMIVQAMEGEGIKASVVGKVLSDPGRRLLHRRDGTTVDLKVPDRDPFWQKFFE